VPNVDSVPLFDRLLDAANGGRFSMIPASDFVVERRYRPDSNVVEQTFTTAGGVARVTESLNSGISGRLPWSELARRIEGVSGSVEFRIEARIGTRLDEATSWRESSPHGDVLHVDGLVVALRSTERFARSGNDDSGVSATLVTEPGSRDTIAMLVSADSPIVLPAIGAIDRRIDRSDEAWREWSGNLAIDGPYANDVRRSALALKLLVFSPTGSVAAAATTSLPERLGGDKNYDYRYAWIRDVAYTIKAFLRVGAIEEAAAAFRWLIATIGRHDGRVCTMYRLDGSLAPEERELDVPGYAGSRPVRSGNRARDQLQLGIFGDILETAALFVDEGHLLDLETRALLGELADRCADLWHKRDAGIWELEKPEHYTISKIGCWMALDRAVVLADKGQVNADRKDRWARERDRIRDWIDEECWSESKQSYTLHPGTDRLDASLLLATRFGFERRDRLALTREAVRRELARGPLVYRYSGMEKEEGTFVACGFWLVEAYALLGDVPAAVRQMDGMLAACSGNLGLLGEEIDATSGEMLGNVPQALSHLALIHASDSIAVARAADSSRPFAS
jgi:GH15 family glucan-1,4-alpha-glucosidase